LRDRLTGDELLLWTVETFTMFYDKTWAQRSIIPVIGLMPLLISIFTFVYDNYSDIDLALEYYGHAFNDSSNEYSTSGINNSLCKPLKQIIESTQSLSNQVTLNITSDSKCEYPNTWLFATEAQVDGNKCQDITRTPAEYRTAFITNVACMALAMLVSYVMCVRELLHHSFIYMRKHRWRKLVSNKFFIFLEFVVGGICLFPIGPILAPFFILYIGITFQSSLS
jgi:hypothetical protein